MHSHRAFKGWMSTRSLEQIIPVMPNIQELYLVSAKIYDKFLEPSSDGSLIDAKFLPSLRSLHSEDILINDNDRNSLLIKRPEVRLLAQDHRGICPYLSACSGKYRGFRRGMSSGLPWRKNVRLAFVRRAGKIRSGRVMLTRAARTTDDGENRRCGAVNKVGLEVRTDVISGEVIAE